MQQKLSYRIGNFLYSHAFWLYKPVYSIFKNRTDSFEIRIIKEIVKSGSRILDIGSNIGYYTELLSELAGPSGKVTGFEPDSTNFRHLTKRVGSLKNVSLHNLAVSDKAGTLHMYTSHRLNVDHRTYEPEQFDSKYEIEAVSLDEFLDEDISVDFIKMDIQGAEFLALKGMQRILNENPEICIITELSPHFLMRCSGTTLSEFTGYLNSLNFDLFLINRDQLVPYSEDLIRKDHDKDYFENLLAVKGSSFHAEPFL